MKVFIVDDEPDSRGIIASLIKTHFPTIQIVGEADNIKDAIGFLNSHSINLLFLDIQLQNGTGFDILNALDSIDFDTIFITAFDQYAIEAIKNNAQDYILKPIDREEFNTSVEKALNKQTGKNQQQLQQLLQQLASWNEKGRLRLPTQNGFKMVEVEQIIRLEADSNYTQFILDQKPPMLVSKTMKSFEELLLQYHFIRIHHSHLVNVRFISEYIKGRGGEVILKNGDRLSVSEGRKAELLRVLKQE